MGTVFVFKSIKPQSLNMRVYDLELYSELNKEGVTHRRILARTTTTWKNRPEFQSITDIGEDAVVLTGPGGNARGVQQWEWLDGGVGPHTIRARNAPMLRFQTGYTAATSVGKFTSQKARRHGPWARRKSVRHPGIEARGWSVELTKRRQKPFENRMEAAMRRAANRSF